jgi:hypothetical protein
MNRGHEWELVFCEDCNGKLELVGIRHWEGGDIITPSGIKIQNKMSNGEFLPRRGQTVRERLEADGADYFAICFENRGNHYYLWLNKEELLENYPALLKNGVEGSEKGRLQFGMKEVLRSNLSHLMKKVPQHLSKQMTPRKERLK